METVVVTERDDGLGEERRGSTKPKDPPSSASELLDKLAKGERPTYTRKGEIARGGMGAILRIRDEALRRDLAMKVILEERGGGVDSSSAYVQRFLEEAQVTAQLDHPGVVPVHELGVDQDGKVFFTMKLVEGRTLGEIFKLVKEESDDWSLTRALQLFIRVCETLAFAHAKGVVHRDLKPANIMVGDFGEVYVMDWGLAKVLGEHADPVDEHELDRSLVLSERTIEGSSHDSPYLTQAGDVLGTPSYMPLEQAVGRNLDARSDVYAIGAMLYELLVGHTPYGEPEKKRSALDVLTSLMAEPPASVQERAPKVPAEIAAITDKAMARDPANRYQSAAELGQDLRHFVEGRVVQAYRTGPIIELKKWVGRNRALAGAVAAVLVLLVVGLVVTSVLYRAGKQETADKELALRELGDAMEIKDQALQRARDQRRTARALALASASLELGRVDPMGALLLARESARAKLLPEVVRQLRSAIQANRERVTIRGHERKVNMVVFSPEGDLFLTCSDDATARLWDITGRPLAVLRGHGGAVNSVAFSPSGDRVVTGSADKTARIWNLDGLQLSVLRGHKAWVRSAEFLPSGDRVITCSGDKTARIWDLDGKELAVLDGHEGTVRSAVVSPSGDQILTAGGRTVRMWGMDGRSLKVFRMHEGRIHSAVFSPSGDRILSSSYDDTARLWDLAGNQLAVLPHGRWAVWSAKFSPSGDRILTCAHDSKARLWDSVGNKIAELSHDGHVYEAMFSASGDRVLTCSGDKTASLWNLAGFRVKVFRGHKGSVRTATFSPSGDRVLTGSDDGSVRLWDLESQEPIVLRTRSSPVSIAFSPSGKHILTGLLDNSARLWNFDGKQLAKFEGHKDTVTSVAFSSAGDRVLTSSRDRTARMWDLRGKQLAVFRQPEDTGPYEQPESHYRSNVKSATFSPLGDRVLVVHDVQRAILWDLNGQRVWDRRWKSRSVPTINHGSYTPSGKGILLAGPSGWALLSLAGEVTTESFLMFRDYRRDRSMLTGVALSPSGDRVIMGTTGGTAHLADLDGHELAVFRGHDEEVSSAVFSPQGDRVLTGSADKTARVWDLAGKQLDVLRGHGGEINKALFSPSGDRILTAGNDGTARLWLARVEDLVKLADKLVSREFTSEERDRYALLLQNDADADE